MAKNQQTTLQDVERGRAVLVEKKTELQSLRRRCISKNEIKRAVVQEIEKLAESGAKDFVRTLRSTEMPKPGFLHRMFTDQIPGTIGQSVRLDLLMFAFKKEFDKNANAAIDEHWPEDAIEEEERAANIKRLESEIVALEEQEEAFVRQLNALGMHVDRRPDALPAVVLRFNGPDDWDRATFEDLERESTALGRVSDEYHQKIQRLKWDIENKGSYLRHNLIDAAQRERSESAIKNAETEIEQIRAKIAAHEEKRNRVSRLFATCRRFLEDHQAQAA